MKFKKAKSPRDYEARAKSVYVISRGHETCKIGISSSPRKRLSTLQISTSDRLKLSRVFSPTNMTALALEKRALSLLAPYKARGEWLNCSPHLAELVIGMLIEGREQDVLEFLRMKHTYDIQWGRIKNDFVSKDPESVERRVNLLDELWAKWPLEMDQAGEIRL